MNWQTTLKEHKLKATKSRLALLEVLNKNETPLTAEEIHQKLSSDQATVYRALKEFQEADIVRQIDFQHGHAHYELVRPQDHHHHVICKKCEKVEDIQELQLTIPKLKNFKIINHSLEFYGICKTCSA